MAGGGDAHGAILKMAGGHQQIIAADGPELGARRAVAEHEDFERQGVAKASAGPVKKDFGRTVRHAEDLGHLFYRVPELGDERDGCGISG